jgi:hypothetical protein
MAENRDTATNTSALIQVNAHLQASPKGEKLRQAVQEALVDD